MSDQERWVEIDNDSFWWKVCEKDNCGNQVCLGASEKYCYPHSAWYRPILARINPIIDYFDLRFERKRH